MQALQNYGYIVNLAIEKRRLLPEAIECFFVSELRVAKWIFFNREAIVVKTLLQFFVAVAMYIAIHVIRLDTTTRSTGRSSMVSPLRKMQGQYRYWPTVKVREHREGVHPAMIPPHRFYPLPVPFRVSRSLLCLWRYLDVSCQIKDCRVAFHLRSDSNLLRQHREIPE